jgi:hypothetical protein
VQILFSSKFYGNLLIKKKSHGKFFLQKTLAEHYTLNKEKCFTEKKFDTYIMILYNIKLNLVFCIFHRVRLFAHLGSHVHTIVYTASIFDDEGSRCSRINGSVSYSDSMMDNYDRQSTICRSLKII